MNKIKNIPVIYLGEHKGLYQYPAILNVVRGMSQGFIYAIRGINVTEYYSNIKHKKLLSEVVDIHNSIYESPLIKALYGV